MGVLANRDFIKMNGLGNEIVVVDLRQGIHKILNMTLNKALSRSEQTRRARQPGRSRTTSSWRFIRGEAAATP